MNDFREELYRRYSSTFKEHISEFDEKNVAITITKYRYQYLPILKEFNKDVRILELGCGRGIFLEFLINNGYKNVFGIDVSKEQIDIAKAQNLNVEEISVLEYLKNNNEKFDLIFAIDLIEHFYKDELIPLFEGIYNNLKNGGAFVFHTPNGLGINANRIIYCDLTHLTIFAPNSAIQILKLVGFNKIKFYETEPYAKNLNGALRLILWKTVKLFFNGIRLIETGGTEKILTQNFICVAFKG
ncbi:cyclopropane-fatty-acyl-phospholipid synthase [bacterium BMS3Abin03]|nr:cyclopropane-fatty-acyl-phospholipid synthase [bacterium BMS3Abin03]